MKEEIGGPSQKFIYGWIMNVFAVYERTIGGLVKNLFVVELWTYLRSMKECIGGLVKNVFVVKRWMHLWSNYEQI